MAADDKEAGGNINYDFNNATAGLNLDSSLNQVAKGNLTYALNAVVENSNTSTINYQNEQGNELCLTFPEGFILIGNHFINEKAKHIFFITNPMTEQSEIGYMDNNDCIYHTLISDPCLGFNINHPIQKIVHKITNDSTEIYWPDNIARRYLDIENIPYKLASGSLLCDPEYSTELDCNQLKVQPNFNIPTVDITDVIAGGALTAGTVQFAVQYADASSNPFTAYYSVTNPTPIADPQFTSVNFNFPVGKSVIVEVGNLDVSGQFQYFNLAVIKTINAISSVELVGTYFIDNVKNKITYTGQNQELMRLSLNDIFEKFPYYELADDITTAQDILIWKGLTSIDRINYQEIASKITLQWESWRIPDTETYADELNATNFRGYLRDEIYAIEINFQLTNGKETDSFHIPGRVKNAQEIFNPDIPETDEDFIGDTDNIVDGVKYKPYWSIYNTATVIATENVSDSSYKGKYAFGEFAFWESAEEYPCNTDLWGELAGQKIRHHKFPDILVSPMYESAIFVSGEKMAMQKNAIFPLGIKIDTSQVQSLIDTSNLTDSQKADIVGFKIVRGDRGTNKSIIAKGMLRNVNKYEREDQSFYYPNYPYNDLKEDVFLNINNNSYTEDCQVFTIEIATLVSDSTGGPSIATVTYTDCNTNKTSTITYDATGTYSLCSITKPIMGEGTTGTIWYTEYDEYSISVGYVYDPLTGSPLWHCAGYHVEYNDIAEGLTPAWINPSETLTVKVLAGGPAPVCVDDDCSDGCPDKVRINLIDEHRVENFCGETTSIKGHDDSYRQIFNSPETSFGQPFLGTVLKLENVMFGAGRAHFVEVKDNAKYRLLTEEAQEDALLASEALATITDPLNYTAMFTAYQAYLTIFTNGITRKNYAYSFNSIASYDYSKSIPNDSGIKQRNLDISRYLIPGVQAVGDDYSINNYNRETSVFLKTSETKTALPFPDKTENMLSDGESIMKDNSRFTISEIGSCGSPGAEKDISVVSYYASIKNDIVNQWGQIYSYDTIDTGFQKSFNNTTLGIDTVFGGDTFIGKFGYKTKLPFFLDNRVGAPDDSDVFYDEIGNIAYPKYWHSARSILKDYSVDTVGIMYNIISYKAHNFDCPNSQGIAPDPEIELTTLVEKDPNRTFYDGYFYLFAYGIPSFYCESSYNLDLRQAFNNKEGDFWPHVSTHIPDEWLQETNVSILNDNSYYYNITYSKQNKETTFSHIPVDWEDKLYSTNYPFRAIYSDVQNTDSDNKVNNWLTYRALSYFDFPQNYGELVSLDGIQNSAVLARFDNKTLLYNNLLTMDTSNPQAVYVGNPRLFDGAPPIDFAETDLGYIGTQNKILLKIPQGQISIDAKRGQVFLIRGTEGKDISGFGSGLQRFFSDNLSFEILNHFSTVDIDNNYTGIGIHGVYDSKYDRVILTKLDYIPITSDIQYDEDTKEFFIEFPSGLNHCELAGTAVEDGVIKYPGREILPGVIRKIVELQDTDYFYNKSWSLSFNLNTNSWISFHSYTPNWYVAENNFFYSGINNCCTNFEFVVGNLVSIPLTTTTTSTLIYSSTTTTTTTILDFCSPLEGVAIETNCDFVITAEVTEYPAVPDCEIPEGLNTYSIISGYTILSGPTIVDTSGSEADAIAGMIYINQLQEDYSDTTLTTINSKAAGLTLGEIIYSLDTETLCGFVEDGWYFTNSTSNLGYVFQIVSGAITQIKYCGKCYSSTYAVGTDFTDVSVCYTPYEGVLTTTLVADMDITNGPGVDEETIIICTISAPYYSVDGIGVTEYEGYSFSTHDFNCVDDGDCDIIITTTTTTTTTTP